MLIDIHLIILWECGKYTYWDGSEVLKVMVEDIIEAIAVYHQFCIPLFVYIHLPFTMFQPDR